MDGMEPEPDLTLEQLLQEMQKNFRELEYQLRHQTETGEISNNLFDVLMLMLSHIDDRIRINSFMNGRVVKALQVTFEIWEQSHKEINSLLEELGADTGHLKEIQDKIDEDLTAHEELLQALIQIRQEEIDQLEKLK